ncbi:ATP synthase subunit s, mitochondrial [Leguminivora glycinivorella]|uniref:ATP synthase subunit s, mitochondrial n=1 Tax=Leguminivora glycinivorella TaxID=1035111 RepID=UPI00200C0CB3|nr:ATP synthase subunit s, mitochondrial [Leguminivora glycinivorella]
MWTAISRFTLQSPKLTVKAAQTNQVRCFWEYVNMMFNKPDAERIKLVGPDRACAEWVLRNGGSVEWVGGQKLADYNLLPANDRPVPKLAVIDGTDSSISHYGFAHLIGCTKLYKIILHKSSYIDDRALKGLSHGKDSLTQVQVSDIDDVSDAGVKNLKDCHKLQNIVLFNLKNVNDMEECIQYLASQLPNCKIQGAAVTKEKPS